MSDNLQPPFRMPCEAVAGRPLYFFGAPFQHALDALLTDKFVNTTVVDNPDTGIGGTVPPYERFTPDLSGGGSCEMHSCVEDGPAPCAAWLRPFTANAFSHTPGDTVNFATTRKTGFKNVMARRYWNGRFGHTYRDGDDTWQGCGDLTTRVSWRSVQSTIPRTKYLKIVADSSWHIVRSNFSDGAITEDITRTAGVTEEIDSATGIRNPTAFSLSPNQLLGGEPDTSLDNEALIALKKAFWTWTDVVNRMTNFISSSVGCTIAYGASSATMTDDSNSQVVEQLDWDVAAGTFNRTVYNVFTGFFDEVITEEIVITDATFAYTYHENLQPPTPEGTAAGPNTLDIAVNGTLSITNTDATIYADAKTLLAEWDLTDDAEYPWRADPKVSIAPLVSRDELRTAVFDDSGYYLHDYGSPVVDDNGYTIGDQFWVGVTGATVNPNPDTGTKRVAQDFPGSSIGTVVDIQVSGFAHTHAAITCTVIGGSFPSGVSMTSAGHITGTIGDNGHWGVTIEVTCGVAAATGDILGAPKPAGYQNYFDFNFQDMVGCCFRPPDNPGFQTWSWYQHGWGMDVATFNSNSGCHLPLNTTQWTNYFQSVNKPQGAWLFYNDTRHDYFAGGCVSSEAISGAGDADALWACKYAEALEQWPSQNFALPSGDAKFWFDENHVYCAENISGFGEGSTWSLTDPTSGLPPSDLTDFTGIWGSSLTGGFYNVTSYSAGVLTLGAKVYDVPSNWHSKSNDDGDSCIGKLRYLGGASVPASLLGRSAVTTTGAGTTFTFAVAQPAFGMDTVTHQEQVDLYDVSMTVIAANVTATRISDTQFSTIDPHASAVWATIHGAAKWYMNDPAPKGDFTVLDWLADFRSWGEHERLAGILNCDAVQVTQPTTNAGGGPTSAATQFKAFNQTQGCLPFVPCAPKVICISPNSEAFANGITYDFPGEFICDQQYGSKWWAFVQSTMTDLLWQRPHRPCNIKPCSRWTMDGGICANDTAGSCPGDDDYIPGESESPEYFFGHAPQVEARLMLPGNYGNAQDESAPALPDGIQIGWLSPVDFASGEIAYPPEPPGAEQDRGNPAGAATAWDLHDLFCAHAPGCRFNYKLPAC